VLLKELVLFLGYDEQKLTQTVLKDVGGFAEITSGSRIKPGTLLEFAGTVRKSVYKAFFDMEVPEISVQSVQEIATS